MSDVVLEATTRDLYPVGEAMERLGGLSRTTLYELMKSGRLRSTRIGRRVFISAEEIDRFIKSLHEERAHDGDD